MAVRLRFASPARYPGRACPGPSREGPGPPQAAGAGKVGGSATGPEGSLTHPQEQVTAESPHTPGPDPFPSCSTVFQAKDAPASRRAAGIAVTRATSTASGLLNRSHTGQAPQFYSLNISTSQVIYMPLACPIPAPPLPAQIFEEQKTLLEPPSFPHSGQTRLPCLQTT